MTAQGLIVLPPLRRPVSLRRKLEGLPTADEQGLCLGSTFDIFATNGKARSGRLSRFGRVTHTMPCFSLLSASSLTGRLQARDVSSS